MSNDPRLRIGPWPSKPTGDLFSRARELHRAGLHDQARAIWFNACELYRTELVSAGALVAA